MSSQEAAYHVLSLPLSKKSRSCIFINTSPIGERVLMLKSIVDLKKLEKNSTEVFMVDVFEKYTKREENLENICLADFAANYVKIKRPNNYDQNDDEDYEIEYRSRQKTSIIRYRRYKLIQDPTYYYREQILLFMPWRKEENQVENIDHKSVYNEYKDIIESNRIPFSIISDEELENVLQQVENDLLEKQYQETDEFIVDKNLSGNNVDIFQQGGEEENKKTSNKQTDVNRFVCPPRVQKEKLNDMICKLNSEQKEFVMHILNCFKLDKKVPLKIFLSGSAGVGKSTVINTIYQMVTNHFDNLPGRNLDKVMVLLCAPSGKAAFLINGTTLHTAFALPINQYGGQMPDLSSDVANKVREKLSKLKLLIIDEISMVGSTVLSQVDTRLRQIMGINQSFGGVSVLVVGDLNQLPPVMDRPVYQVSKRNEMTAFFDHNFMN